MFYSKSTKGFYLEEFHGTEIPEDAVEITLEEHAALIKGQSDGKIIVADIDGRPMLQDQPPPTTEQIIAGFTVAIQQRLDNFAMTRGYDNILSAATYATSTVAKFATEGQYAVDARDATWAKCYDILADIDSGIREVPTLDELLSELPALAWP